jgi:hypothetical protein
VEDVPVERKYVICLAILVEFACKFVHDLLEIGESDPENNQIVTKIARVCD